MKTSELQDILANVKVNYAKSESENKSLIKKELEKIFGWVYCPRDNFTIGVPDIWFTDAFGVLVVIELKKQNNRAKAIQSYWLNKIGIRSNAFLVFVQRDNTLNIIKY